MPSSNFQARMDASLTKAAKLFREKMIQNGIKAEIPSGLDRATWIDTPKHTDKFSSIDIIIELKKAPWAGAYEYGSGEHGEEGKRYRIPNEGEGDFVAFPLELWPQYKPPPEKKYHYFPWVLHPGVKARPYIRPTIKDTKDEIRKIFARDIKLGILAGVPKVTIIK